MKGKRGVTADTALRLAKLTGMDAGFWMGLQADYDLWYALKAVDLSKITLLKNEIHSRRNQRPMTGPRMLAPALAVGVPLSAILLYLLLGAPPPLG